MRHRAGATLFCGLPLLLSAGCSSAPFRPTEMLKRASPDYPPWETYLIRAAGDYRVRLDGSCGPDHCHTRAYLELLVGEIPRGAKSAVEIREVSKGVAVYIQDVQPVWKEERIAFDLFLGEQRNAIWRITPLGQTGYQFEIVKPDQIE